MSTDCNQNPKIFPQFCGVQHTRQRIAAYAGRVGKTGEFAAENNLQQQLVDPAELAQVLLEIGSAAEPPLHRLQH